MDSIKATYFQECDELLGELERGLLAIQEGENDGETINAVFRAVHSIKGGAGAFGFESLVTFSHTFETALDDMRSGRLDVTPDAAATMLRAADVLADLVAAARVGGAVDAARCSALAAELSSLSAGQHDIEAAGDAASDGGDSWEFKPVAMAFDLGVAEGAEPAQGGSGNWLVTLKPQSSMYAKGHDAAHFLRELHDLGAIRVTLDRSSLPSFDNMLPEEAYFAWDVELPATVERGQIEDIFDFVGDDCPVTIARRDALPESVAQPAVDEPFALAPPSSISVHDLLNKLKDAIEPDGAGSLDPVPQGPRAEAKAEQPPARMSSPSPTIRVDLERIDRLIDLVGELVINQAMIAQRLSERGVAANAQTALGLDELEQLTREIQDSVMAIRAQPVRSVFERMPRLIREISASTGKRVKLVTEGEGTEVDKTVIERLTDPITHMLRNAIDHGLETPEQRIAAGKPEEGLVRLAAFHRSGRIVIEVSDDGKGIDRARVRAIATDKGLIAAEAALSDDEIDNLIFLPGFSTASVVSNISGRGVGMDVVKKSVQALGGRITIASRPGEGSVFTLSLPLTLAVLDGMVVTVEGQAYVTPLTAMLESLRPRPADVRRLGPSAAVLSVRGAHVPLIDVGTALNLRTEPVDPCQAIVLLVESEIGGRAALVVDEIRGQRQVVIKSLEANYRPVEGVAAATILGDGRVALILDVDAIVGRRTGRPSEPTRLAEAS